MKIVSWNVNGIRAAMEKGLRDFVQSEMPDVLCLQEVKAELDQIDLSWAVDLGYQTHLASGVRKGYSGTAILTRIPPLQVRNGLGQDEHDQEGRVIVATYPYFHLVNVYTPNAQRGLLRLDYRLRWDADFLAFLQRLRTEKPVIFCGDLNCAHQEIDLANPKQNRRNAGFTDEERAGLSRILEAGFLDSFRQFEAGPSHYTWWSHRFDARSRNIGWRIDYFMVDSTIWERVEASSIRPEIQGSDHCPIELLIR
jgi:exodeoxyribonuclease-3